VNAGVAEQDMTGIAAGLALCGKIVFTYSIANFPTLRCFEQIRNDVCYHNANVKVVSVGGGLAYGALGVTHHATEDIAVMRTLPNMTVVAPGDAFEAELATRALVAQQGPAYLRLGRSGEPRVHWDGLDFQLGKSVRLTEGSDITLIATGTMLYTAVQVAERLSQDGIQARVLSMHTVKPLDAEAVHAAASETAAIVTIEEHSILGGLGSRRGGDPGRTPRVPSSVQTLGSTTDVHFFSGKSGLPQRGLFVDSRRDPQLTCRDDRNRQKHANSFGAPSRYACGRCTNRKESPVTFKVPFVDPKAQYQKLKSEIDGAIGDCLTKEI